MGFSAHFPSIHFFRVASLVKALQGAPETLGKCTVAADTERWVLWGPPPLAGKPRPHVRATDTDRILGKYLQNEWSRCSGDLLGD